MLASDLSEITRTLDTTQIPWGIFAGAAAHIYGAARPLQDLDILIPSDAGAQVAAAFPAAELAYRSDGSIADLTLTDCEIIAGLTENVHLEMDAAMIARLLRRALFGVNVAVLSLEDNLVFKAVLGRGPEVGKHDWDDIAAMLAFVSDLDWDYLGWRLHTCAPQKATQLLPRLQAVWLGH